MVKLNAASRLLAGISKTQLDIVYGKLSKILGKSKALRNSSGEHAVWNCKIGKHTDLSVTLSVLKSYPDKMWIQVHSHNYDNYHNFHIGENGDSSTGLIMRFNKACTRILNGKYLDPVTEKDTISLMKKLAALS